MSLVPSSIPNPTSGTMSIGSLQMTACGLMIALGVIAAVSLAGRRLAKSDAGTGDDMSSIATWAVIGGVVGARLCHVVTDWSAFSGDLGRIPMIWKGGLGIPGGLLGGVLCGVYAARRRGVPIPELLTAAARAVPLAQSIGRWGNWWNQELFAVYLAGYFSGRFWIEGLRIDPAHVFGGLRLNQWVAVTMVVLSVGFLLTDRRSRQHEAAVAVTTMADGPAS